MDERELLGLRKPSEASDEGYFVIRIKKKYAIITAILIILIIVFVWGFTYSSNKNPSTTQVQSSISSSPTAQSVVIPSPKGPTNTKSKKNGNTLYGMVVSFSGNGFMMQTRHAVYTVTVTLSTVITGAKGTQLQLSKMYVNDRVKVSGVINNAAKTVSAATIKDTGPMKQPVATPTATLH